MQTTQMDGILFTKMMRAGASRLSENRERVNDLNVFPIPDGDTGDNMFMTIDSGVVSLQQAPETEALDAVTKKAARGMLLGSRGNSGVILSQIFSGISRGLEGVQAADVATFNRAFEHGVDTAYQAVAVPVEGTILTVYRDAVRYASDRIDPNSTFESYFDDFVLELHRSLDRTPELLSVLKEAGVVDSGGAGFVYIAEGMHTVLTEDAFSDLDEEEDRPPISSAEKKEPLFHPEKPRKAYGIVSVAAGSGIRQTFLDLGSDAVVDGGQSMNPSAEEFLAAFSLVNADTILVFPNNSNILLTARQAATLYADADVRVVPTRTIGEGYCAISMLDTESADTDQILTELSEVIAGVVTGMVSQAIRSTSYSGLDIHEGDFVGFVGDTIHVDAAARTEAVTKLADCLHAEKYDILMLVQGVDAPDAEAVSLQTELQSLYPSTEVILLNGDQPIYDYILILE